MKSITLKSKKTIVVDSNEFLGAVNSARKEFADNKKDKAPITLEKLVSQTNVLKNRDSVFGMIQLRVMYDDAGGSSCVRDFPNFGLNVTSESTIKIVANNVEIDIDVSVKAGKKKWEVAEMTECAEAFNNPSTRVTLGYVLDETTEWGGHTTNIDTKSEFLDERKAAYIPITEFSIDFVK